MSFSCPQATFAEMLALAAQYGYDGVEPRAAGAQNHRVELEATAEQRASFRAQATDAGIAICCLAAGNRFADPADRDAQVEETLQYIDLAADIGAPALRLRREYFLITTLAFAEIIRQLVVIQADFTRGTVGVANINRPFDSFVTGEISSSPGGLPYRWAIKSILVLGFALLGVAALSRLTRIWKFLFLGPQGGDAR